MNKEEIDSLWPLSENYEYSAEIGLALRQTLPGAWKEWQTLDVRRRWPLAQARGFQFLIHLEEREPEAVKSLLPGILGSAPSPMKEEWEASLTPHLKPPWAEEEEPSRPKTLPPLWAPPLSRQKKEELWGWTKEALGEVSLEEDAPGTSDNLRRVHSGDYIYGLRLLAERGGGRLTPETEVDSWEEVLQAAGAVRSAAFFAWREQALALAFAAPGSHHAGRSRARGSCLVNNLAIAAEELRLQRGLNRVAILDIDAHHGNGSEEIFLSRGDVLTVSVHQAPPFFPGTGSPDIIGSGLGKGANLNIALKPTDPWSSGAEKAVHKIKSFGADILLIQFGGDAHWRDAASDLTAKNDDFKDAGEMISTLDLPVAIELGASTNKTAWMHSLRSFLSGLNLSL